LYYALAELTEAIDQIDTQKMCRIEQRLIRSKRAAQPVQVQLAQDCLTFCTPIG
jgi:hypothetical protein